MSDYFFPGIAFQKDLFARKGNLFYNSIIIPHAGAAMKKHSDKPKRGFFRIFGKTLDVVRKIILNLIFWSLLVFIALALIPGRVKVKEDSLLYIQPQGQIVDALSLSDYPARLSPLLSSVSETSSIDMGLAIRRAAQDDRIIGLVLDCSGLSYASLAVLQDLEKDLNHFRESGKRIYAWSPSYNQYAYYLASTASLIYLDEMGSVTLSGFGVFQTYFKKGMDKWDLGMAVFQAGDYKSFVEPYMYEKMSQGVKEDNRRWTGNLWHQVLSALAENRSLTETDLTKWIEDYPAALSGTGKSGAELALEGKLIDVRGTWETFSSEMTKVTGYENDSRSFRSVHWLDYLEETEKRVKLPSGKSVAVITASGEIHSGSGSGWTIASRDLIDRLESAENNRSVRAIVLRLDTGGGSAYASEEVRRTLERLRSRGITVLVSMGGITASGGYWIASESDELWCSPGTITGSIGVFSMVPETDRFLEEHLGITGDGVGTTWMSGQGRPDQPLNRSSRQVLQAGVDSTYSQFLRIVSENRNIPVDALEPLARGRIWTGEEAVSAGLADRIGSLTEAVERAAELAHLEEYHLYYVPRAGQDMQGLLSQLLGGIMSLISKQTLVGIPDLPSSQLTPGKIYALSPISDKNIFFHVDNRLVR